MLKSKRKKRKDGNYQASITIGKSNNGKPIKKVFYAKTIKELENKVISYKALTFYGMLPENDSMNFEELVDVWKEAKTKIGFHTMDGYMSIIKNHLLPDLSHLKVKNLMVYHLQKIIDKLAESGMGSQLKGIKKVAVQVLDVALGYDIINRNPFKSVKLPEITVAERRPLSKKVQDLVYKFYSGHRMGIPALFLLFFGIRRGELVALKWDDVDTRKHEHNYKQSSGI